MQSFGVPMCIGTFFATTMFVKNKENFISKSKEVAKRGAILSAAVFAVIRVPFFSPASRCV